MRLADAKRLKPGDVILCGTAAKTADSVRTFAGVVRKVTPRGGIRIDVIGAKTRKPLGWAEWVPYHHVIRKDWNG